MACRNDATRSGCCVWLTGLSGSGKSTIAGYLIARLVDMGHTVSVLDGDDIRANLSPDLGFSKLDRDVNVGRIAFVAREIVRHKGIAVCPVISPHDAARKRARRAIGPSAFVLVHVATPLEICEARDPKGLYRRARRGELGSFTGLDDPYDVPDDADLVVTTVGRHAEKCAADIAAFMELRGFVEGRHVGDRLVTSVAG